MSGDELPDSRIGPIGPMYIVDLLAYLKTRNHASWLEVSTLIELVRLSGPVLAKAEMLDENSCTVRVHVGYGLFAVIEMDRDRTGRWEPILGQIVKD